MVTLLLKGACFKGKWVHTFLDTRGRDRPRTKSTADAPRKSAALLVLAWSMPPWDDDLWCDPVDGREELWLNDGYMPSVDLLANHFYHCGRQRFILVDTRGSVDIFINTESFPDGILTVPHQEANPRSDTHLSALKMLPDSRNMQYLLSQHLLYLTIFRSKVSS